MQDERVIKVVFLAYREWALRAIDGLAGKCNIKTECVIRSKEEYDSRILEIKTSNADCIVLIGWSWIIEDDILEKFCVVGMHPSDLPMFRGGSPIQHQIIAGIEKTKITLMTISPKGIDVGDIWLKEDWDLTGSSMQIILDELTNSTTCLLIKFFNSFDSIIPQKQDLTLGSYYKRRTPKESRVTWDELSSMSLKDVYNMIRALGDPYPNMYIEDEDGNKLLIKEAEFVSNK